MIVRAALLVLALLGRPASSGAGAQQQGQPPLPDPKKAENSDLDRIPNPQSPAADAESPGRRNGNQRLYVENAFTGSTGRSNLPVPVPQSTVSTFQGRVFVDVRREWRASRHLTFTFSDRLNVRAQDDLAFPTRHNVINEWREGSFSWEIFNGTYLDAGRINLKSGAALGFNPTDFFKTRAVEEPLSNDPSVLREDRLGALMVETQYIGQGRSLTVALAPAVTRPSAIYSNTNLSTFNPAFDHTNDHYRLLVK